MNLMPDIRHDFVDGQRVDPRRHAHACGLGSPLNGVHVASGTSSESGGVPLLCFKKQRRSRRKLDDDGEKEEESERARRQREERVSAEE